ncbi:MAG: hydantoinase/oxoprolinase family protein [Rhizobiaceae bacterium]
MQQTSMGDISIGVDTGGTFTDLVCQVAGKPTRLLKVPSTPNDPSQAVMNALDRACQEWGIDRRLIKRVVHGTTVGTNAVLERKGARIGLLTSEGFRDVFEIGRQVRDPVYRIRLTPATPVFMLPRSRRKEVPERLDGHGRVLTPIDLDAVRNAVRELQAEGVTCIAVAYLFSYLNPEHELATRRLIEAEFPDIQTSLSVDVDPRFREYERTLATSFDAYIKPVVSRYLNRLKAVLTETGVAGTLQLMQSGGGTMATEVAVSRPVRLFLSGPAGGVIGAQNEGMLVGERNLITIDIGGTSSDIALIADGMPLTSSEGSIGGWPVRVPMVEVHALGAGGGSIARVDASGALSVGPESCGASPGPACYDQGGTEASVTDAALVLGYLNPDYFADGTFRINPDLSLAAVAKRVADPLDLTIERAAVGVHRVVNANMAEGIRLVSTRKGFDPRNFVLVPLGGGGGTHATALADELSIERIMIPRSPGVLSAQGLLSAPIEHETTRSYRAELGDLDVAELHAKLAELDSHLTQLMALEGVEAAEVMVQYTAELCYVGQSFFLDVPLDVEVPDIAASLHGSFVARHEQLYGHAPEAPVMIVSVRSVHRVSRPTESVADDSLPTQPASAVSTRPVLFLDQTAYMDTPVYLRHSLAIGQIVEGPALLEQADTTVVVSPGWRARVHQNGPLMMEKVGKQ